ncbi:hypothetical protein CGLO_18385 [Colletotrichum gloeosporioides Cg-14]|uniref:Uncharacterized protein n=1 Tax=Colletotrichum gloeosporioides (strain Cg-14) TaxID=1237896 RepID=T0KUU9_COLGC|nr:hypothetical protein CGLO_18385 [Colletotrichum gloeosporioides Cg-14]
MLQSAIQHILRL